MRCLAQAFGCLLTNQVHPLSQPPQPKKLIVETIPLSNPFIFPDFDENSAPNKLSFDVHESGTFTFSSRSIKFETESTIESHETERLDDMMRYIRIDWSKRCLDLDADPNSPLVKDFCTENPLRTTWLALDKNNWWDKGYLLAEGDVFSLGRVTFKVKAMCSGLSQKSQAQSLGLPSQKNSRVKIFCKGNIFKEKKSPFMEKMNSKDFSFSDMTTQDPTSTARIDPEQMSCRICLDEVSNKENPIVHVCKCSGTLKGIHVNCLRRWFGNKMLKKESGSLISLYHKPLFCEICKAEMPDSVKWERQEYSLIEFPEIKGPHIILEARIGKKKNGYHVISFGKKTTAIQLGRQVGCDIRIMDESIEMKHAVLSWNFGRFYVESLNKGNPVQLLVKNKSILIGQQKKMRLKIDNLLLQITSIE